MPYALRKAPKRDLYWVVNEETGMKHSKDPIPKERAEAQRRALYASERTGGSDCGCGGGMDCHTKAKVELGEQILKGGRILKDKEGLGRALPVEDIELLLHQFVLTKHPKTLKNLNAFIKDTMKKLDCGCGCEGEKGLTAMLKGGKLKQCPEGYSDNGAGLCVENCKSGEQDTGVTCVEACPPGKEDTGIECITKECDPGFSSSGVLTCYKPPGGGQVEPKKSHYTPVFDKGWGGWHNTVWQGLGGGDIQYEGCPSGWTDDGVLCRAPIIPAETRLKPRTKKAVRGKRMESSIDLDGTFKEIAGGLKDLFEGRVDLAQLFDPEKNGVGAAFRKFGENTKKAFEDVGQRMLNAFDPDKNGVRQAFEKFGKDMGDTIGNKDWWNKTMTDPDTYIMLLGVLCSVAATVLSAGTAGPLMAIALQTLGPATKMIADAARGKPIDGLDIASLVIGMVPIPGAAGASGAAAKAIMEKAALGVTAAKALPYVARAAQVGQIVVLATKVAQVGGYVPSTCVANCNANTEGDDLPPTSECQDKKSAWKSGNVPGMTKTTDPEGYWTEACPKPDCDKKKWKAATGCAELTPEQKAKIEADALAAQAAADAEAGTTEEENADAGDFDFGDFDFGEPDPLPEGWTELVNEDGEKYYVNESGEETTERPSSGGPQTREESMALQEAERLREAEEEARALAEAEEEQRQAEEAARVAAETLRQQEEQAKENARIAAEDAATAVRLKAYMEQTEAERWAAVQNNPNAPKTDAQWDDYKDYVLTKHLGPEWSINGTGVLGGADLSPQEFTYRWQGEEGISFSGWKRAWDKTQFAAGEDTRLEANRLAMEAQAKADAEAEAERWRLINEADRLDFNPPEPTEEPSSVVEGGGRKFERRFGMTSKEFLSLPHMPDMDDVARKHKMKHEDAMEFARSGAAKPFPVMRQMRSQRPVLARVQALQRQRIQQSSVKIKPTHLRPNLLGEVPLANSIGTWGGARARADSDSSSSSESDSDSTPPRRGKGRWAVIAGMLSTLTAGLTAGQIVAFANHHPSWMGLLAGSMVAAAGALGSMSMAVRQEMRRVDAALAAQQGQQAQLWHQAQAAARQNGANIDPQALASLQSAVVDSGDPEEGSGGDRPRVNQQEMYYPQNLDFESQGVVGN